MIQPKISVIVPVYNLEKYLERTVTMLREQTYRNLEIILVDDGSTDATPAICDCLAEQDPRIVVFHTENRGVSAARNAGLKAASGEYIGFCDGDDLPEKDMYEYLYRLISDAAADISVCGVLICYEGERGQSRKVGSDALWESPQEAISSLINRKVSMSLYSKLFRADVVKELYLPEGIRVREDEYYSYAAFSRATHIVSGAQTKYRYLRRKDSGSMAPFSEKYYDILKVCQMLEVEIGSKYPELRQQLAAKKLKELIHIYKLMILRKAGLRYIAEETDICRQIRSQDWSFAIQYLSRNDRIRYEMMKCSKWLYYLFVKVYDRS